MLTGRVQEKWLECCGIEGPNDWDRNVYFNCSSEAVGSREACGVPFSCCKLKPQEIIKNKQCGYDVRKQDYIKNVDASRSKPKIMFRLSLVIFGICSKAKGGARSDVIYERGCLRAGEDWIENNLVPVAGVAVGVAILQ
ncbi:hypothetical protein HAZT_HAZT000272, partial [Hyalella azteca]